MVTALKRFKTIPKYIIILTEADIINAIEVKEYGVTEWYGQFIEWLITRMTETITDYKKKLPFKAKKGRKNWPIFVMVEASLHTLFDDFSLRVKFNNCINKIADAKNINFRTVTLSNLWCPKDMKLVVRKPNNFTPEGWRTFYSALDNAIEKLDRQIFNENKKEQMPKTETRTDNEYSHRNYTGRPWYQPRYGEYHRNDRHHFYKKDYGRHERSRDKGNERKLPTPPVKKR